jgi:hypothetical protein
MVKAYYKRLTSQDRATRAAAARAWSMWEAATSYLQADAASLAKFEDADYAAAFARIECHYFINKGFLQREDQLLRDVKRIRHIPGVIVQGRYDVVCPVRSAWDLHRAWPEAELRIVPNSGHSAFEAGISRELVAATDRFAKQLPVGSASATPPVFDRQAAHSLELALIGRDQHQPAREGATCNQRVVGTYRPTTLLQHRTQCRSGACIFGVIWQNRHRAEQCMHHWCQLAGTGSIEGETKLHFHHCHTRDSNELRWR